MQDLIDIFAAIDSLDNPAQRWTVAHRAEKDEANWEIDHDTFDEAFADLRASAWGTLSKPWMCIRPAKTGERNRPAT